MIVSGKSDTNPLLSNVIFWLPHSPPRTPLNEAFAKCISPFKAIDYLSRIIIYQ